MKTQYATTGDGYENRIPNFAPHHANERCGHVHATAAEANECMREWACKLGFYESQEIYCEEVEK